jgi:hypothetical protein
MCRGHLAWSMKSASAHLHVKGLSVAPSRRIDLQIRWSSTCMVHAESSNLASGPCLPSRGP